MTNSSLIFKNKPFLLSLGIWIASLVYFIFASNVVVAAITGTILLIIGFMFLGESDKDDVLEQIESVLLHASKGKLEGRITSIDPDSLYGKLAWSFNNLLDQVEAYMRESIIAIQLAEKGEENHIMHPDGFKGLFQLSVTPINKSCNGIKSQQLLFARRQYVDEFQKIGGGATGGLMTIRNDIINSNKTMEDISLRANNTSSQAKQSLSSIDQLLQSFYSLSKTVSSTYSGIEVLSTKTNEISAIADLCKKRSNSAMCDVFIRPPVTERFGQQKRS